MSNTEQGPVEQAMAKVAAGLRYRSELHMTESYKLGLEAGMCLRAMALAMLAVAEEIEKALSRDAFW